MDVPEVDKLTLTQKWFFATGAGVGSHPEDIDRRARSTVAHAVGLRREGGLDATVQAFEAKLARDSSPQRLENAREVMGLVVVDALLREFELLDGIKSKGACVARVGVAGLVGVVPVLAYLADEVGVSLREHDGDRGYGLMHWAAVADVAHVHVIRWLAHRGVSVDDRCSADADGRTQGLTPLHLTAQRGRLELSLAFLMLGADPNLCSRPNPAYIASSGSSRRRGRPPLQFAATRSNWEAWDTDRITRLIDIFASHGADLSIVYDDDEGDGNILDGAIALADDHDDPIVLHLRDAWGVVAVREDASSFGGGDG